MPNRAKRAEAFLGFGDIVVDIKHLVERIADNFAMILAQQMIDRMVQSSVKWMQSGFEGNPAYVTDPRQFFTDIADQTAGSFIEKDLGYLCSPFQANIRLSLIQEYYEPLPFQCTLTEVVDNIEGFYDDFSQGGWDAWFSMTQNPTNNPYGAYLKARVELDSRIANAVGLQREQLTWNQGFLSWSECIANEFAGFNSDGTPKKGKCIERGPVQTPGSTLKAQLDKVLPSGLEKLVTAQHMDQLISGFAAGLLNRYVFGSKGLFASGKSGSENSDTTTVVNSRLGKIDLDGDGIPDGFDADQDGKLTSLTDVCYHGGQSPSCSTSSTTPNSPYYTPICQATNRATLTLTEYTKFIDKNAGQIEGGASLTGQIIGGILGNAVGVIFGGFFGSGSKDNFKNEADADIWSNRTTEVDSAINEVISNIQSYNSDYFDSMEISVNRFSNYIGKVQESLIKDHDLDLAKLGSGGGGLESLMKHSAYNLRYLQEVKTKFGNCTTPNVTGINSIPKPPEVEPLPGGGGSVPPNSCQAVTRDGVLNIVSKYAPTDAGLQQALPELQAAFGSQVTIYGIPAGSAIDRINFGGGMVVDVISSAGTANASWGWIVNSSCGSEGDGGGGGTPPPSLESDVSAERAKYRPEYITNAEAGAILNAVAWKNRDIGWGLSRKDGGTRCPVPNSSITVACDVLYHQPSQTVWDVFTSSSGTDFSTNNYQGRVTWSRVTVYDYADRPWIAPVAP